MEWYRLHNDLEGRIDSLSQNITYYILNSNRANMTLLGEDKAPEGYDVIDSFIEDIRRGRVVDNPSTIDMGRLTDI